MTLPAIQLWKPVSLVNSERHYVLLQESAPPILRQPFRCENRFFSIFNPKGSGVSSKLPRYSSHTIQQTVDSVIDRQSSIHSEKFWLPNQYSKREENIESDFTIKQESKCRVKFIPFSFETSQNRPKAREHSSASSNLHSPTSASVPRERRLSNSSA